MRRIHATARPSDTGSRPQPMDATDARAWEITRQRHPHLYAWREVIAEAREIGEPPFAAGVIFASSALLVIAAGFSFLP